MPKIFYARGVTTNPPYPPFLDYFTHSSHCGGLNLRPHTFRIVSSRPGGFREVLVGDYETRFCFHPFFYQYNLRCFGMLISSNYISNEQQFRSNLEITLDVYQCLIARISVRLWHRMHTGIFRKITGFLGIILYLSFKINKYTWLLNFTILLCIKSFSFSYLDRNLLKKM